MGGHCGVGDPIARACTCQALLVVQGHFSTLTDPTRGAHRGERGQGLPRCPNRAAAPELPAPSCTGGLISVRGRGRVGLSWWGLDLAFLVG